MGMQLIETIEVGSGGAASIEFTSIPQDGVDLVVLISGRAANAADYRNLELSINSSTSNQTAKRLVGDGSSVASNSNNVIDAIPAASATANTFGSICITFSNYAGSTNKSISIDAVTENNATAARAAISAHLWSQTSAITSIGFAPFGEDFVQYSTASLYKITAD